jgi:hypothetical protein
MWHKLRIAVLAGAAVVLFLPALSVYYEATGGKSCARCHEIGPMYDEWHQSSHRGVSCTKCHGDVLTLDPGFHFGNVRRLMQHVRGRATEQVRLKQGDATALVERCRKCHEQEYAHWKAGPHAVTYARIFLDSEHNKKRMLMDDCLRCHGMHFEGGIEDLVTPVNTSGPWKLKDVKLAEQPAIPCVACHQVHREGKPLPKSWAEHPAPGPRQEVHRPSLALFDRRELTPVSVKLLGLPEMKAGEETVKVAADTRQALCYQCHAPVAGGQAGSGDDRTPMGVHEGISCLACHQKHGQETRASCANCHPRMSNCGLDVEKMDTTFLSRKSKHNIHIVKCADCHEKGVPPRKNQKRPAFQLARGD